MLTEHSLRVSSHEAAHAVIAHLLNLQVGYISRDAANAGSTLTYFRDDDPRPVAEKAFVRGVIAIGAVICETGPREMSCDDDVVRAESYARLANTTLDVISDRARELLASDLFRTLHRRLEEELIHRPSLDAAELREILR